MRSSSYLEAVVGPTEYVARACSRVSEANREQFRARDE
jgi:hypothetical protein